MKIIFALLLVSLITIPTVSAIPLADKTGFKFSFPVTIDGSYYVVEGTTNFDIQRMDHDAENNEVTLEMVIEVMAKEFPEFLLSIAEENFIRGYQQGLADMEAANAAAA